MSVSRLLTSEDTGAPTLQSGVNGSLTTLLKAVLVDGYGDVEPLGWSLWDEDLANHTAIFRPDGVAGIVPFLSVKDNSGIPNRGLIYLYESMSTTTIGLDPCPLPSIGDYRCIVKGAYTDTTAIPWKVIGDSRGFWLLTQAWVNSTDSYDCFWMPHYIGEYTCNYSDNKFNLMTILNNSNLYGYFYPGNTPCTHLLREPYTQTRGAVQFEADVRFKSDGYGIYYGGKNPQEINGRRFYEPFNVKYDDNFLVGTIPGILNMIYEPDSGDASLSLEERQPIIDTVSENTSILTTCFRYSSAAPTSTISRLSFIIGNGFRDAR